MKSRKTCRPIQFCLTYLMAIFIAGFLHVFSSAQDPKPQPPVGVEVVSDIEYANREGRSLTLDIYRPFDWADYNGLPVVIWIHGGGWVNGSKENCPAAFLAQKNITVVSINYRLATEAQWPAQINDCYDAVRWVRKNAKTFGFTSKIGVWGSSAGGHLAALLGTRLLDGSEEVSSRVEAVCDFFGPVDLLTMPPNVITKDRTREQVEQSNGAKLLGKAVMDVPDLARDASALHHVSIGDAPFLIVHGAEDPGVPVLQSQLLNKKLKAAGVETELIILQGAKHGGPEFTTDEIHSKVIAFFKKHLL